MNQALLPLLVEYLEGDNRIVPYLRDVLLESEDTAQVELLEQAIQWGARPLLSGWGDLLVRQGQPDRGYAYRRSLAGGLGYVLGYVFQSRKSRHTQPEENPAPLGRWAPSWKEWGSCCSELIARHAREGRDTFLRRHCDTRSHIRHLVMGFYPLGRAVPPDVDKVCQHRDLIPRLLLTLKGTPHA